MNHQLLVTALVISCSLAAASLHAGAAASLPAAEPYNRAYEQAHTRWLAASTTLKQVHPDSSIGIHAYATIIQAQADMANARQQAQPAPQPQQLGAGAPQPINRTHLKTH